MASPELPEWRPRRTLIDLYNERHGTPWYYHLLANFSALVLGLGFIIFPSSYIETSDSTTTPVSAVSSAIAFIVFSYIISMLLAVFLQSWIFHLEVLYLPHLTSSGIGLLSTAYYLATHRNVLTGSKTNANYAIAAIVLSVLSMVAYGILSLLTLRKIYIVRARDAQHRQTIPTKTEELLPESEQQRKQLLRLLLQQEEYQASIPDDQVAQTYQIDLPEGESSGNDRSRRNTLNTLRGFPRFGHSSRYNSRRSSLSGSAPADYHPSGLERVPTMIREESTINSAHPGMSNAHNTLNPANLATPRPAAFSPRAHSALFNTAGVDESSRAPSYCEHAHPSMHIDVQAPAFQQQLQQQLQTTNHNGYPIEKVRHMSRDNPTNSGNFYFTQSQIVEQRPPQQQRAEYQMAVPPTSTAPVAGRNTAMYNHPPTGIFHDIPAQDGGREEIELTDRGPRDHDRERNRERARERDRNRGISRSRSRHIEPEEEWKSFGPRV